MTIGHTSYFALASTSPHQERRGVLDRIDRTWSAEEKQWRRLALEQAHQGRLLERVEMQVEAHQRRRTVHCDVERVLRNRKYREDVAVGMVVLRRTGAEIAGDPQIRPRLQRTCRKRAGFQ